MSLMREHGQDRRGVDWLNSRLHKKRKKKKKKLLLPKSPRNCIALLSSGKRCKNKKLDGQVYCLEHMPQVIKIDDQSHIE